MDRTAYFEQIKLIQSPLLLVPGAFDYLLKARAFDSAESMHIYVAFAEQLQSFNTTEAKTRSAFIKLQCQGINTEDMFAEYHEGWGIPKFTEGLVTHDDFKNGFLWTFRDHTSSWTEDEEARSWFYTNPEARFARRYEYYSCDRGPEELLLIESGDFKSILALMITKHGDLTALVSPAFSKAELHTFYVNHDESLTGFAKEEVLEMITQNPNWE